MEVRIIKDADYVTPIEEITKEHFYEMLNVLPPMRWNMSNPEVFALCEMYSGNVTNFYFRFGDDFYEKRDSLSKSNSELIAEVAEFRRNES